jgi:hypothetical protein
VSARRWRTVALCGAVCVTLAPGAADAGKRDAAFVYLAGNGLTMECNSTGGSCFPLTGEERTMTIAVVDDLQVDLTGARYEVRAADGTVLAATDFCDAVTADVPPDAAELRVLVRALDPVACLPAAVGRGSTGKVRVHFDTRESAPAVEIDNEPQECLEATPTDVGVVGTTDDGALIDIDVLVLLDEVSEQTALDMFSLANQAYEPLGLRLVPKRLRPWDYTGDPNAQRVISEAINTVKGSAPEGFDLVHVLTSTPLNVFGIADCLGGVRYPDRAFSVSVVQPDRNIVFVGPVEGGRNHHMSAKTLAHEIGHLLGGHHHLGSHVEGEIPDGEPETATIMMSPRAVPASLRFSAANGAIIRGHADRYAR